MVSFDQLVAAKVRACAILNIFLYDRTRTIVQNEGKYQSLAKSPRVHVYRLLVLYFSVCLLHFPPRFSPRGEVKFETTVPSFTTKTWIEKRCMFTLLSNPYLVIFGSFLFQVLDIAKESLQTTDCGDLSLLQMKLTGSLFPTLVLNAAAPLPT